MAKLFLGTKESSPVIKETIYLPKEKFGLTIDNFVGDVDENGTLNSTTWTSALDFAGVKTIGKYALYYAFYKRTNITSVDFRSLTTVGKYALYDAFYECTGITSVDLSSLQSVSDQGLGWAFDGCTSLTSVNLSSLQSVGPYGMSGSFRSCTSLTSVDLSSLQTVEIYGLSSLFRSCTSLTAMSFPALTSVHSYSFTTGIGNAMMFGGCANLTEIHFRTDMQATIEAMYGYDTKWGATNATIYFDL